MSWVLTDVDNFKLFDDSKLEVDMSHISVTHRQRRRRFHLRQLRHLSSLRRPSSLLSSRPLAVLDSLASSPRAVDKLVVVDIVAGKRATIPLAAASTAASSVGTPALAVVAACLASAASEVVGTSLDAGLHR